MCVSQRHNWLNWTTCKSASSQTWCNIWYTWHVCYRTPAWSIASYRCQHRHAIICIALDEEVCHKFQRKICDSTDKEWDRYKYGFSSLRGLQLQSVCNHSRYEILKQIIMMTNSEIVVNLRPSKHISSLSPTLN